MFCSNIVSKVSGTIIRKLDRERYKKYNKRVGYLLLFLEISAFTQTLNNEELLVKKK
jgi:hypothetical protein